MTLALPYDTHPAFSISKTAGDHVAIEAFNDAYTQLETGASTNSRRALEALDRVFASLEGDSSFGTFTRELLGLARRRLNDDIAHFLAQRPARGRSDSRTRELEDRKFFLTQLSAHTVAALQSVARVPLAGLRVNAKAGKVRREDLSINQGAIPARIVALLDREFEDTGVHEVVSAYAQRAMRVAGVALELSVPSATWWRDQYQLGRAPQTLYAHTDEGLSNPKAIAYLTDVSPTNGPMSVYPGCEARLQLTPLQKLIGRVINSVGGDAGSPLHAAYRLDLDPRPFVSVAFREHFSRLPTALRYNSHLGWDVVPGSELEATLVTAEQPVTGPAGTIVIFDGARLLHRGGMVEHSERVALQIVFAASPSKVIATATRALAAGREVFGRRNELRTRLGRALQQFSRDPHQRLMRLLAKVLPELTCIDVGASYYPHPPWELFQRSRNTNWFAVEPNAQNTAYLDNWPWPSKTTRVPCGLSEHGGAQTLYVTATDSGSSLFPPVINADMEHRDHDRDYYFPVVEKSIATKSLDEVVPAGTDPLFVKLDTQGSELAILRGAVRMFASNRVVGIETEATLLANPVMVGSGKFWEMSQFLEQHGFELLQLKPIEGGPFRESKLDRRTYLNECDAVFCLRRSELLARPIEHRLAAIGFYVSYHLYDEALSMLDTLDVENAAQIRTLLSL